MDPYDSGKTKESMAARPMQLRRIDAISAGRVLAILYALIFAIFGGLYAIFAILGGLAIGGDGAVAMIGVAVGVAVVGPVIYGAVAFVMGVIMAAVYNLVAGWVGGIEVHFE